MKFVLILIVNLERVYNLYNIKFEKAKELIEEKVLKLNTKEKVKIEDALGRIIVEDVYAPMSNPPFDKSPLDGFALRHIDTKGAKINHEKGFEVIDVVWAGNVSKRELDKDQTIRIMTGAKMPKGADCIIRIEDVEEIKDGIIINKELKEYENYCFMGEDIKKEDLLIRKSTKLNSIHLGVLSSMGIDFVEVYKKPRIKILVTGNEVTRAGNSLEDGKIYDTNGIMLSSRLKELGYTCEVLNILEDNIDDVGDLIISEMDDFDLLITTGGVSVGDKDIINEVIDYIGAHQVFWRVKMKPGTPIMLSTLDEGKKAIVSLSGNPFAALVNFEIMVRDVMYRMYEDLDLIAEEVTGIMLDEFNKKSKVRRYIRCIYKDGYVKLPSSDKHASGMLNSMADCNALMEIEAGNEGIFKDDKVKVFLL